MTAEAEIDVIVRCRNEMPWVERTLAALREQRAPRARILFVDCRSTDGSRVVARRHGVELVDQEPEAYVPGRVLNEGMRRTRSAIVAFVNADAVPLAPDTLAKLIAPLQIDPEVAASYGRQVARSGASRLTQLDHERAFPRVGALALRRGEMFSMAGSAIARRVWSILPFDEDLRYSEDIDWTQRARALGHRIAYVPGAELEHSHDYDLRASFRRRHGEGAADTAIHRLGHPSLAGDLAHQLVGALLRDARAGVVAPASVAVRCAQVAGYFAGRRATAPRSP
jgi:rhamnosyltransferase